MNIVEIFDINDFRLELYTKFNEVQLQHYFEPNGGVFIAETPMVIERALEREAKPLSFLIEKKAFESQTINDLLSSLETENINIFVAELEVINKLTGEYRVMKIIDKSKIYTEEAEKNGVTSVLSPREKAVLQ